MVDDKASQRGTEMNATETAALKSAGWLIRNALGRDKMSRAIARFLDGTDDLAKMPTLRSTVEFHVARINAGLAA
jgi:hypothetical protein